MAFSEYAEDSEVLDRICGNILDVETEQQKTNELLGQVLEELRKLNKALTPIYPAPQPPAISPTVFNSGYTCMFCGGWISTPAPHNCRMFGSGIS